MMEIAFLLGLLFMLLCVGLAVVHSIHEKRVTLFDWSVLAIGGVYGGGWSIVVYITTRGGNPKWEHWLLPYESLYPVHTFSAILLLCSVCLGWFFYRFFVFEKGEKNNKPLQIDVERLIIAAWVLFLIAFLMQWLYANAYGGFIGLLDYSVMIRKSIFKVDNPLSFLQPFAGLTFFASFIFFGLLVTGQNRLSIWVGFLLSVLFSLYILFSWKGRIGFMVYLTTFFIGAIKLRRLKPVIFLVVLMGVMIFVVAGAYVVSVLFDFKSADDIFLFAARQFSFPFGSFFAQLDLGQNLHRAFRDFFIAPVYFLPSSWWLNWVDDVGRINTIVVMGAAKGEQGVTSAIPVDLITLGLMQASFFGVAVVGFLWGAMLHLIENLLEKISNNGMRAIFEAYVSLKVAVLGVFYSHPSLFISGNFALFVSIAVIVFFLVIPQSMFKAKLS